MRLSPEQATKRLKEQSSDDNKLPPVSGRATHLVRQLAAVTNRRLQMPTRQVALEELARHLATTLRLALGWAVTVRQTVQRDFYSQCTVRDWLIAAGWLDADRVTGHLPVDPDKERRAPVGLAAVLEPLTNVGTRRAPNPVLSEHEVWELHRKWPDEVRRRRHDACACCAVLQGRVAAEAVPQGGADRAVGAEG